MGHPERDFLLLAQELNAKIITAARVITKSNFFMVFMCLGIF